MCCVTDKELTSPVMTSSVAGTDIVMTSKMDDRSESAAYRQQVAPPVFGNLLSSVHREVESTLRQLQNADGLGTSSDSLGAAAPTLMAVATPLTALSSSPCMRDVCDAIIVQALQQGDQQLQHPQDAVTASLEPQRSESNYSSHQKPCWTDFSRTRPPSDSRSQQQFDESKAAHVPTSNSQPSRFPDSKSDSSQYSESRLHEQVNDCNDKQLWSRVTNQELCGEQSRVTGFPLCSGDPKSCFPASSMEKVLSRGIDVATEDDGESSDGVARKTEADVSSHEDDDVDSEDQPLCIDLNRDDNEDDTIAHL